MNASALPLPMTPISSTYLPRLFDWSDEIHSMSLFAGRSHFTNRDRAFIAGRLDQFYADIPPSLFVCWKNKQHSGGFGAYLTLRVFFNLECKYLEYLKINKYYGEWCWQKGITSLMLSGILLPLFAMKSIFDCIGYALEASLFILSKLLLDIPITLYNILTNSSYGNISQFVPLPDCCILLETLGQDIQYLMGVPLLMVSGILECLAAPCIAILSSLATACFPPQQESLLELLSRPDVITSWKAQVYFLAQEPQDLALEEYKAALELEELRNIHAMF